VAEAANAYFVFPVSWGMDLQSEHEKFLTEKLVGRPVVVMNYPKEIKAFYMRQNDDGRTVAAMDVLASGIGEIIGRAQREERLDVLEKKLQELGLRPESYWWYLDLRRYGTVPHAKPDRAWLDARERCNLCGDRHHRQSGCRAAAPRRLPRSRAGSPCRGSPRAAIPSPASGAESFQRSRRFQRPTIRGS
jgi:hypothetical protein